MIKKTVFLFSILICTSVFLFSQQIKIEKIEPPNWWTGMKWKNVQLMIYGENLNSIKASFNNKNIKISKIHKLENPSYAFIDIEIPSSLKPGDYKLTLQNNKSKAEYLYTIREREKDNKRHVGFDGSDVIYLVMPDRFANGDTLNDIIEGYGTDLPAGLASLDRSKGNARHGGDLQGIINNLDYIKDLGFTAIWLNPVVENNTNVSYHGYGATDFYKVDPRLGSNELYKTLVDEAHKRDLKIILDHVANHIHINHQWMKNLPMKDVPAVQAGWINGSTDSFHISNHDKIAIVDVHGNKTTLHNSTTGWFTDYMPDLNQKNPFMAKYIIQNTIWWMEYAGIDGIREDTYPYADPEFMADWAKAILTEYPNTNIVGEVWKGDPVILSTYQEKSAFTPGFNTYLPAVTDFGLSDALRAYMNGTRNITHIYEMIGMDFAYHNPYNLVTFIDNHDVIRAMLVAKEDLSKVKIALQILLTTRGIPQLYYGFEIGMIGGQDDGSKRMDFPGGFPGDERNAFTAGGRTETENNMFDFTKQMIKIRQENKALQKGKLIHFPPAGNIYYYFRIHDDEKILIVVNDNNEEKNAELSLASGLVAETKNLKNLKTGEVIPFNGVSVTVPPNEVSIYKLLMN